MSESLLIAILLAPFVALVLLAVLSLQASRPRRPVVKERSEP